MGVPFSNCSHVTIWIPDHFQIWTVWIPDILDHKPAFFSVVFRPPFEYWTIWQQAQIYHLNTGLVRYSDGYRKIDFRCLREIKNFNLQVLNVLHSMVDKSNINKQLEVYTAGGNPGMQWESKHLNNKTIWVPNLSSVTQW